MMGSMNNPTAFVQNVYTNDSGHTHMVGDDVRLTGVPGIGRLVDLEADPVFGVAAVVRYGCTHTSTVRTTVDALRV